MLSRVHMRLRLSSFLRILSSLSVFLFLLPRREACWWVEAYGTELVCFRISCSWLILSVSSFFSGGGPSEHSDETLFEFEILVKLLEDIWFWMLTREFITFYKLEPKLDGHSRDGCNTLEQLPPCTLADKPRPELGSSALPEPLDNFLVFNMVISF